MPEVDQRKKVMRAARGGRAEGGGAVKTALTERDRHTMGLLGLARFLSSEQLGRLAFPGRSPDTMVKRLRLLAPEAPPPDGGQPKPAATAYLRRERWRNWEGTWQEAWALSERGCAVANALLPNVRREATRAGADFMEHALGVSELFCRLVERVALRPAPALPKPGKAPLAGVGFAKATGLPFRWRTSEGARVPWRAWEALGEDGTFGWRDRVVIPDAVMEAGRRRVFVEYETGSHTIATANPKKKGATLAKVEAYHAALRDSADPDGPDSRTFYERHYGDDLVPELLIVTASPGRADAVRAAVVAWQATQDPARRVRVSVDSVDRAAELLLSYCGKSAPPVDSPQVSDAASVPLTPGDVEQLVLFYRAATEPVRAARDAARRKGIPSEQLPAYPSGATEAYAVLSRLRAHFGMPT